MAEWQYTKSIGKKNTTSSKASLVSEPNNLRVILNHEEKVSSKGEETQFRRNDEKSVEIGRKYRIMRVLQAAEIKQLGGKNASLVSRTQISEFCQTLTANYSKPDCLKSNCRSSDPYRSIDGCCNNLESPTQGRYSLLSCNKTNPSFIC